MITLKGILGLTLALGATGPLIPRSLTGKQT